MNEKTLLRLPNSCSYNLKSKIQNLKWGGIVAIAIAFAICGAAALAQQPARIPRIGFLGSSLSTLSARIEAFRQGLRELGYVEGENVVIEWRSAEGIVIAYPHSRRNWCALGSMSSSGGSDGNAPR